MRTPVSPYMHLFMSYNKLIQSVEGISAGRSSYLKNPGELIHSNIEKYEEVNSYFQLSCSGV